MVHLWLRAETRPHEGRAPLTAEGAALLIATGVTVTVERSRSRVLPLSGYDAAGCRIVEEGSWTDAPPDAVILGLREPGPGVLSHRHVMFGHAYRGQPNGVLARFVEGGGTLLDLESLVDDAGARLATFGTWEGFSGAAVALHAWAAQQKDGIAGPVGIYPTAHALVRALETAMSGTGPRPRVLLVGAPARVVEGATDLCHQMDAPLTVLDEVSSDEVLHHEVLLGARVGGPVLVSAEMLAMKRNLSVVLDLVCAPDSAVRLVGPTTWEEPCLRLADEPPMDLVALDNLGSLLPMEASVDFAGQLLPHLKALPDGAAWKRARGAFEDQR